MSKKQEQYTWFPEGATLIQMFIVVFGPGSLVVLIHLLSVYAKANGGIEACMRALLNLPVQ